MSLRKQLTGMFCSALLAMCATTARADTSDFQAWSALALSGTPSDESRFLLWFDGHARFRDDAGRLGVSIIRPGIGWRVSESLDLWLGYARVVARAGGAPDVEEDRVWQQATYPISAVWGGKLSGRSRLEQRFRDSQDDTGWRIRQFLRWEKPLASEGLSVVLWDELFVDLNNTNWGQDTGFGQNRLFAGLARRWSQGMRAEIGYLHNAINTAGPNNASNHNLSASLFISF